MAGLSHDPEGGGVNPRTAEAIGTERFDLLPLRVEHAEEMVTVLSGPALHSFIGGAPDTPQALRSRYKRLAAGSPDPTITWCNWVIHLRGEACLTGTLQATMSPLAHIHPDHAASAAVAAACGLTPSDDRHDDEIRWSRRIGD